MEYSNRLSVWLQKAILVGAVLLPLPSFTATGDQNEVNATRLDAQLTIVEQVVTERSSLFATTGDKARVSERLTNARNNIALLKDMATKNDVMAAWFLQKVADTVGTLGDSLKNGAAMAPLLKLLFDESGVDEPTQEIRGTSAVVTSGVFPLIVSQQIFYDLALAVAAIPAAVDIKIASGTPVVAAPVAPEVKKSSKKKMAPGAIAGAVIGSTVGALALAGGVWALYNRRSRASGKAAPAATPLLPSGPVPVVTATVHSTVASSGHSSAASSVGAGHAPAGAATVHAPAHVPSSVVAGNPADHAAAPAAAPVDRPAVLNRRSLAFGVGFGAAAGAALARFFGK